MLSRVLLRAVVLPGSLLAFEVVSVDDIARQRAWVAGTDTTPANVMPRPPLASRPAQVVTVTSTAPFTDPLQPHVDLLRVFWDPAEALTVPVPCSVKGLGFLAMTRRISGDNSATAPYSNSSTRRKGIFTPIAIPATPRGREA